MLFISVFVLTVFWFLYLLLINHIHFAAAGPPAPPRRRAPPSPPNPPGFGAAKVVRRWCRRAERPVAPGAPRGLLGGEPAPPHGARRDVVGVILLHVEQLVLQLSDHRQVGVVYSNSTFIT